MAEQAAIRRTNTFEQPPAFALGDSVVIKNHPRSSSWSAFGTVREVDGNEVSIECPLAVSAVAFLGEQRLQVVRASRVITVYLKNVMLIEKGQFNGHL